MANSSKVRPKWETIMSLLTPCQFFLVTSVNCPPFLGHFLMLGGHLLLLAALLLLLYNEGRIGPGLCQRWDQAVTLSAHCMCVCSTRQLQDRKYDSGSLPPQSTGHACLQQGMFPRSHLSSRLHQPLPTVGRPWTGQALCILLACKVKESLSVLSCT